MTPQMIETLLRINDVMYQSAQKDLDEKYESIRDSYLNQLAEANLQASNQRLLYLCKTGKPYEEAQ